MSESKQAPQQITSKEGPLPKTLSLLGRVGANLGMFFGSRKETTNIPSDFTHPKVYIPKTSDKNS